MLRVEWTVVGAGSRPPSVGSYLGPAPFPLFDEQLALGVNPSPAAAVGGGCRYGRGGRFARVNTFKDKHS